MTAADAELSPHAPSAILRVVTLASKTGRYGGPFDTATRQAIVAGHNGSSVVLAAGYTTDDKAVSEFDSDRVVAAYFKVRGLVPIRGFIALFSFEAARVIRDETRRATHVHISLAREAIPVFALWRALAARRVVIVQPHGMLTSRSSSLHRLLDVVLKPMVHRSNKIVALTEIEAQAIREWLGRSYRGEMVVLGNPVPTLPLQGIGQIAGDVLFLARLHPRKQVATFLEAGLYANTHGLAGDYTVIGPDEGDLYLVKEMVRKASNVKYGGVLSAAEVTERVAQTALFVLPSQFEPWGNVLVTALALHKPVIVTKSAALAADVERYGAGLVVQDGDIVAIAEGVHRLLTDSAAYQRASEGAQAFAAEKLSSVRQSEALAALYEA